MTRSTDVVTQPDPPIDHRDPAPSNTPESPWTAEDEAQAEALAAGR